MGVGRGQGRPWPPWILKFSAKRVVFLVLSGKKQISQLLTPPGKILENPLMPPPLEKVLPMTMRSGLLNV